jgi:tRNA G18 (ribose-2'-O)-methylase SpoU
MVRNPVSLLLYNIRSLYNVGSIFRTADSAGVTEVLLYGYTPRPPRKEISKTALGATETVPWHYSDNFPALIARQKALGQRIAAVELTNNSRSYKTLTADDFPLCLVVGNEITGIDDDALDLCDIALEIPMYGVKHSLNVAVATGIITYAAVEQYHQIFPQ